MNSSKSLLSVGVRGENGYLVGGGLFSTGSQGSLAGGTLPSTAHGSLPQIPDQKQRNGMSCVGVKLMSCINKR